MEVSSVTSSSLDSCLIQQDGRVIWHPYTQVEIDPPPVPIRSASGALLWGTDGTPYVDGTSSWWVTLHGHCHPEIHARISRQLSQLDHCMFGGLTHEPAVTLAEKLLSLAGPHFSRVNYSDNGSTAVETALKIAFQYGYNRQGVHAPYRFIAFNGAHHGETLGAMAVSDRSRFIRPFQSLLFPVEFIDPPVKGREEHSVRQLQEILAGGSVACFIFEPGLQGCGGMIPHDLSVLDQLIGMCRDQGVITIADEVLTGFGRLGPIFVSHRLVNQPDMICLSKGLTGGVLPMGATLAAEFLFDGFRDSQREKAFLHGHAYSGNPVGCAAALASLDLLLTERCELQRQRIEFRHHEFVSQWTEHELLSRCDVIGTILAIEYRVASTGYFSQLRNSLIKHFLKHRIILRPFGNRIHVIPPYCITEDQLTSIYESIISSFEVVS